MTLGDLLGAAELAEGPDHIAALAFPEVAGGGVLVLGDQGAADVHDGEPSGRELLRIDDHLHLLLLAAVDVGVRDAGHPLEAGFDDVLGELAEAGHGDRLGQEGVQLGVLVGGILQPLHGEGGVARVDGLDRLRDHRRELGMSLAELGDLLPRRVLLAEDEPGDRAVGEVRGADDRLVGVLGILADLLEPGVDQQEGLGHVGPDGELHRDPAHRVHRLGRHLGDALDPFELLLLLLDDLALDLLRAGPRPARLDGDRRDLDLGCELGRHPEDGDEPEEGHQQDADRHFDAVADEGFDQGHRS